MKQGWKIWMVPLVVHRWILARYPLGAICTFSTRKDALKYLLNGGFPYKKYRILKSGQRPTSSPRSR